MPSDDVSKVKRYRQIIEAILMPYVHVSYSDGDIHNEAIFDRERDHYTIMSMGWQGNRRVHHSLIHLDLINGKVWIQRDGTEDGVGYELEAAGIPKDDIVPAFQPTAIRAYSGYAVA